jgi:hypothetical protein
MMDDRHAGRTLVEPVPLRRPARSVSARLGALALAQLLACGAPPSPPIAAAPSAEPAPRPSPQPSLDACPTKAPAPARLPRIRPEHEQLDTWLRLGASDPRFSAPAISRAAIDRHNAEMLRPGLGARYDLLAPVDPAAIHDQIDTRLSFLRAKVDDGRYLTAEGSSLAGDLAARLGPIGPLPALTPELRVALDLIPVRCGPLDLGLYTPSLERAFDRNLCSMIRPQEPVQVLMRWSDELLLARTAYVLGWIPSRAALSPRIPNDLQRPYLRGPYQRAPRDLTLRSDDGESIAVPFAARLPSVGGARGRVHVATAGRFVTGAPADGAQLDSSERPLSRRALLTDAFQYLGLPYGWGGYQGGRDCSRFLMDLFAGFGLDLPRHSGDQAIAGEVIELPPDLPEPARARLIDEAHRRGLVLLHFPNHIMLYLGRDDDGVALALHSFAEYLVPCTGRSDGAPEGERETLYTVERVQVSDLELGRGTSRGAFIERLTKITIIAGV